MPLNFRYFARLILSLIMVATVSACSEKTTPPNLDSPSETIKTTEPPRSKVSHNITPSEFEFTPAKVEALEEKFLAEIVDDGSALFPPLETYDAASIQKGQEDAFCQDAERIIEDNLKPQNLDTPVQIESLDGYEAVYLELNYPKSDLASLAKNAPKDGRIKIHPSFSMDRTSVTLIDFNHGSERTRYVFTSYPASWRGNSGQIAALKDPNVLPKTWEDIKSPDNATMILKYFVGKDSKIIVTPDNRLFLQRTPKEQGRSSEFYLLPKPISSRYAHCNITWSSIVERTSKPKPNLSAYTSQLWRIQGRSTDRGTLPSHTILQNETSLTQSQLYTAPWRMQSPYNKVARLKSQLRAWSFKDPWSRREYLNLLSKYEGAYSDIAELFEEFYAKPLDEDLGDDLIKQSILNLTGAYFKFPEYGYSGDYGLNTPLKIKIYMGLTADTEVEMAIKAIEASEPSRWVNKTQQLHQILAASLFNADVFSGLLKAKPIPLDTPNAYGKTALMFAAHLNMTDKTRLLLEAGADVNAVTDLSDVGGIYGYQVTSTRSRSALDYAIENADMALIEMLLSKGAKLAPLEQGKYSSKPIPLEDLLAQNPHLDDAQKANLKERIMPRVEVPFAEE